MLYDSGSGCVVEMWYDLGSWAKRAKGRYGRREN